MQGHLQLQSTLELFDIAFTITKFSFRGAFFKREVCFNQESLPITCHKFCHKSLVRPKNKSPNRQGSQPISCKADFLQKKSMHLKDVKFNMTYQNNQG